MVAVQANAPANRFLFTVPLITAAAEVGKTQLSPVTEDRSGAERCDLKKLIGRTGVVKK